MSLVTIHKAEVAPSDLREVREGLLRRRGAMRVCRANVRRVRRYGSRVNQLESMPYAFGSAGRRAPSGRPQIFMPYAFQSARRRKAVNLHPTMQRRVRKVAVS